MKFIRQSIPDIILVEPTTITDGRGYFSETFRRDLFEKEIGYSINFIQDNESKSTNGVLRGLHFQLPPYAQNKLVRVIKGNVLDVAVDIRKSSPTFGEHVAIELNEDNKYQLLIPRGFAHGFVVLSEYTIFSYKVDNYYSSSNERGIAFDDKQLSINWIVSKKNLKLSKKDRNYPNLLDSVDYFP